MKNRQGATDARGICAHSHALPHKPPPGSQENEEARAAGGSTACWGCAGLEGGPPPLQNEVLKTHMGEEQRKTPGGEVGNHPEPRAQRSPVAGAGLLRTPDRDPGT